MTVAHLFAPPKVLLDHRTRRGRVLITEFPFRPALVRTFEGGEFVPSLEKYVYGWEPDGERLRRALVDWGLLT